MKQKRTIGGIKVCKEVSERLSVLSKFYDKMLVESILNSGMGLFYTGKFRNKRVPKYLKIRIPVIRKHFCEGVFESGLFLTTKEITLFKIGTEVIKVPVKRKFKKGEKIRFKRYSNEKNAVDESKR